MIRSTCCISCGKPLVGRQRRFCDNPPCVWRYRKRVQRGAEIRFEIVDLAADCDSGGATAFGVVCDQLVAECFAEDQARWRGLGRRCR